MRICENGIYRDMTAEELAEMEAARDEAPEALPEEPTLSAADELAAQVFYTAMMTDTLMDGEA